MKLKKQLKKDRFEVIICNTLDEVVIRIKKDLAQEDLDFIYNHHDMYKLAAESHFSSGMSIRNRFDLWNTKSKLHKWFVDNLGIGHGDDKSGVIMNAVFCDIKNVPRDTEKLVKEYKEHWARQGVDAITGKSSPGIEEEKNFSILCEKDGGRNKYTIINKKNGKKI